ncbi:MAG: serine hydroxymethyltransferase [Elusimicrobia bacterium RIFCSPLOWO2_02_FULL_39_32]|nr:MAG: serine hydroxymethyltransferase [Elusimicrobia bacterium RIFCSPHIGHO2_02_FULL_39_36]OGR91218.1 MAG: serine hydroxymethyltransferase [Elusimicrobia bacterium RIFCSPLOWO2_02_FULL_39_32]OGS00185.1 MAG: serine hydroxymethyltransferase [Elusimicrobia bacterium RIFCSPLOWO2_12_FULL_39_28]
MNTLKKTDPEIYSAIQGETKRQMEKLELIASENYVSPSVLEAQGSVLTNKYAEGLPQKRYYGGCEWVDVAETLAIERTKKVFGCEHANVQAHSGTQANIAVYLACLNIGDTIMGLYLPHGGHLSHGHPMNFSGKYYKVIGFTVKKETELVDYEEAERLALEHKPKLICVGASAYSRIFDWKRFREICDKIGAIFMADMAHYAGLVAAGLYPSPIPYADFVTTTTHKTLRGPRGGIVMCKAQYSQTLDKTIFPGTQGGPLMHVIAAKAVALGEALKPSFKKYQSQVLNNARAFAQNLSKMGFRIVTGGTDCHMFLVDLQSKNLTGKVAEESLDKAGITVNKNTIPYDPQKPFIASGIRIGTPALTTRGMKEKEMEKISIWMDRALKNTGNEAELKKISQEVKNFCKKFPLESHLKSMI